MHLTNIYEMRQAFKYIYISLFAIFFTSCSLFYLNGYADLYEKKLPYKRNIIDSACVMYYYRYPEYRISDTIIDRIINEHNGSSESYKHYKEHKFFREEHELFNGETFFNDEYILFSEKLNYYYIISIAERTNMSILQLTYLKKDKYISPALYSIHFTKKEREVIKNEFDSIIIPRIINIAKEITK